MEAYFVLSPIRKIEHFTALAAMKAKFSSQENEPTPRLVMISMANPYATDSSSDEVDVLFVSQRVKKYVNQIITKKTRRTANPKKKIGNKKSALKSIHRRMKRTITPVKNGGKFRGVWQRPWRKRAAEIMDPMKLFRLLLGTYETPEEGVRMYDNAAIPPVEKNPLPENDPSTFGYASSEESTNIPPPTSVLRFSRKSNGKCQSNEAPKEDEECESTKGSNSGLEVDPKTNFVVDHIGLDSFRDVSFLGDDLFEFRSPDPIQIDDGASLYMMGDDFGSFDPIHIDYSVLDEFKDPISSVGFPSTMEVERYFEDI